MNLYAVRLHPKSRPWSKSTSAQGRRKSSYWIGWPKARRWDVRLFNIQCVISHGFWIKASEIKWDLIARIELGDFYVPIVAFRGQPLVGSSCGPPAVTCQADAGAANTFARGGEWKRCLLLIEWNRMKQRSVWDFQQQVAAAQFLFTSLWFLEVTDMGNTFQQEVQKLLEATTKMADSCLFSSSSILENFSSPHFFSTFEDGQVVGKAWVELDMPRTAPKPCSRSTSWLWRMLGSTVPPCYTLLSSLVLSHALDFLACSIWDAN